MFKVKRNRNTLDKLVKNLPDIPAGTIMTVVSVQHSALGTGAMFYGWAQGQWINLPMHYFDYVE